MHVDMYFVNYLMQVLVLGQISVCHTLGPGPGLHVILGKKKLENFYP